MSSRFADEVEKELANARSNYPPMNSLHEGFSILNEEVDELWDHVRSKQGKREPRQVYEECVQIAAMAQRLAEDVIDGGRHDA